MTKAVEALAESADVQQALLYIFPFSSGAWGERAKDPWRERVLPVPTEKCCMPQTRRCALRCVTGWRVHGEGGVSCMRLLHPRGGHMADCPPAAPTTDYFIRFGPQNSCPAYSKASNAADRDRIHSFELDSALKAIGLNILRTLFPRTPGRCFLRTPRRHYPPRVFGFPDSDQREIPAENSQRVGGTLQPRSPPLQPGPGIPEPLGAIPVPQISGPCIPCSGKVAPTYL